MFKNSAATFVYFILDFAISQQGYNIHGLKLTAKVYSLCTIKSSRQSNLNLED